MIKHLKHCYKKYIRREDGSTAVEFAFVSLLFLLTVFGIMEAGRLFWIWNRFQYAVEEGARYAAVHDDDTVAEIVTMIQTEMSNIDPNDMSITVNEISVSGVNVVEVSGQYTFTIMGGIFPVSMSNISLDVISRMPTR